MSFVRGIPLSAWRRLLSMRPFRPADTTHVFICIADHFEPGWCRPGLPVERDRVSRWTEEYPELFERFGDSLGRVPQHTYFYPAEEYRAEHLDQISDLCHRGYGDVEVHLHHDHDSSDHLRETLETFKEQLFSVHGLLSKDAAGRIGYGFIHGNWALDNSRPDGRWCGVNDEISILRETGCYADFTMPSAPDPAQTRTINSIYYATDDPQQPKSHDRGRPATDGSSPPDDGLLMIQGPLTLDWWSRKWRFLPRIENGDLTWRRPPTIERLQLWLNARVTVLGKPNWVFVKLHTHGAQEANANMLLGEPMQRFHQDLADYARRHAWFRYYYVTAREMAGLVHQAERGDTGSPRPHAPLASGVME